jgi:hypothetical protein
MDQGIWIRSKTKYGHQNPGVMKMLESWEPEFAQQQNPTKIKFSQATILIAAPDPSQIQDISKTY